jgi:hypothetical protein
MRALSPSPASLIFALSIQVVVAIAATALFT